MENRRRKLIISEESGCTDRKRISLNSFDERVNLNLKTKQAPTRSQNWTTWIEDKLATLAMAKLRREMTDLVDTRRTRRRANEKEQNGRASSVT